VAVSFIGGVNQSSWRKPPTCRMSLTKLYHKIALGLFGPSSKFILYLYTFITSLEFKKSWGSKINICYADMFNKSSLPHGWYL